MAWKNNSRNKGKRYNAVCKFCGATGLRWIDTKVGYRLVSRSGFHNCQPRKGDPLASPLPVGTIQSEEVTPNANPGPARHPVSDATGADRCNRELRPVVGRDSVDVDRTCDSDVQASAVRTQHHLTPAYWTKPRVVKLRTIGDGIDVWLCKNTVDDVVFDAVAVSIEEAYDRMLSNVAHFEGGELPRSYVLAGIEEGQRRAKRRRERNVTMSVVALLLALVFAWAWFK